MIWIHGGGNTTGMPSEYHPEKFVRDQKILFLLVYLTGLDFLDGYLIPLIRQQEGINATSNFGLLDQILAINWIKDNIQFFGGGS